MEQIEVQAATGLPSVGGYGHSTVFDFRYRELLRFKRAESLMIGSALGGGVHSTLIKSTVEALNILEVVTADRIVANIVSTHRGPNREPEVRLTGTRFENLKIAGHTVNPSLAVGLFDKYDTHQSFREAYPHDAELQRLFTGTARAEYEGAHPKARAYLDMHLECNPGRQEQSLPANNGFTTTSLVQSCGDLPLPHWGHVIYVEGFGLIRLAEIRITKFTRSVTMMQLHLGSPVEMDLSIGSGEDGGTDW